MLRVSCCTFVLLLFLPLARCDFSHARKENGLFKEKPSTKAIFPFSRGKNRILQGVENRGSLISVPLALRENPRVRKIRVRNSGAGNGCVNFMDAWKNALFLQEKPMSIKIPRFRGGGYFGFFLGGGGGSADFIFMGARIFLNQGENPFQCKFAVGNVDGSLEIGVTIFMSQFCRPGLNNIVHKNITYIKIV